MRHASFCEKYSWFVLWICSSYVQDVKPLPPVAAAPLDQALRVVAD
jgi:hypothetical protein